MWGPIQRNSGSLLACTGNFGVQRSSGNLLPYRSILVIWTLHWNSQHGYPHMGILGVYRPVQLNGQNSSIPLDEDLSNWTNGIPQNALQNSQTDYRGGLWDFGQLYGGIPRSVLKWSLDQWDFKGKSPRENRIQRQRNPAVESCKSAKSVLP